MRSISDEEIALIKAMLARGMKNKDIQFYFNRPDRSVNSGRVTGIRTGKYSNSKEIPAAADRKLEEFFAERVGAGQTTADPLSLTAINSMFQQDANGVWRFKLGESDTHECKANFGLKHTAQWLRAIAALANNRGGYVLLGVLDKNAPNEGEEDTSYRVVGLDGNNFSKIDISELTKRIKSTFDPTPRIRVKSHKFDDLEIGIIYVEQHDSRPVIATKPEGDLIKEGDILFRYPGQSARIKYSDLRSLLDQRDASARMGVVPMLQKVLALGPERAMVADLDSGELSNGPKTIQIDEDLLDRIKFIREGEFDQKSGALALKLVGDVKAVKARKILKKGFITKADMISDFLKQVPNGEPIEYVRCAVEGNQVDWLPINYFARLAGLNPAQLAERIKGMSASEQRKEMFARRAIGKLSAYQTANGTPAKILKKIVDKDQVAIKTIGDASNVSLSLRGLKKKPGEKIDRFLGLLTQCSKVAAGAQGGSVESYVRAAVCRIDELYFLEA